MTLQEAMEAWEQGCDIKCGNSRSQSIRFKNHDDMLIIFKSDLTNTEWEIKE